MIFWKPAWQGRRVDKALAAVARESDEEKLKIMARKAPLDPVREAAVMKIRDQAFLEDVARHDNNTSLREAAVKKLADPGVLASIATSDKELSVCLTAISMLEDEKRLADIARRPFDRRLSQKDFEALCKAAVRRITDQNHITAVATSASVHAARVEAAGKLEHTDRLVAFIKQTDKPDLGVIALNKLADQKLLADIAQNALCPAIRIRVMERLKDQSVLAAIAINSDTDCVKAAEVITDKTLLLKVLEESKNSGAREKVMQKLGGYVCAFCRKPVWPEGEQSAPCDCPHCRKENHDFAWHSNITEYRDYEVGSRWRECKRCGQRADYTSINTM